MHPQFSFAHSSLNRRRLAGICTVTAPPSSFTAPEQNATAAEAPRSHHREPSSGATRGHLLRREPATAVPSNFLAHHRTQHHLLAFAPPSRTILSILATFCNNVHAATAPTPASAQLHATSMNTIAPPSSLHLTLLHCTNQFTSSLRRRRTRNHGNHTSIFSRRPPPRTATPLHLAPPSSSPFRIAHREA
ncbi:hypothetical protein DEO72_LG5g887 [Vigna unguiculata]|uniref:Uncharacterized protein n=1 Tax=Vigna unguiculata TaxID=3917 RepID=A0A4D6LWS9_VIGUN|nr:hypothetical protein DEO72_LG5g887 [Vigna unguiculata]